MSGSNGRAWDALVFDLDGTLADSRDAIAQTVNRVLLRRGYPSVDPHVVHHMIGLELEHVFREVLPPDQVDQTDSCVAEYREVFDLEVLPILMPIPGAVEAVQAVGGRFPLGVATGRLTRTARQMLTRFGIHHHFEAIVGVDRVPRPKPFPDVLLAALEGMRVPASERVLVIGDADADVIMAKAAGTRVVGVTWGAQSRQELLAAQPDWCVDAWADVLALVDDGPPAESKKRA